MVNYKIRKDFNGLFICPFCNESFKSLVYHTRQKHNINKKELRLMFNLPFNYSLEVESVKKNRSEKALFYNMDKQLIKTGEKTRFKSNRKLTTQEIKAISRGHKKKK